MLCAIDWQGVSRAYRAKVGKQFVVIDDFLPAEIADSLRNELLSDQMWRKKNPVSRHLHNTMPQTGIAVELAEELAHLVPEYFGRQLELIEYWCLLYSKNTNGNVHADFGDLTLTHWLTRDQFNRDPNSGGLILYDVERPDDMPMSDYLVAGALSQEYVDRLSRGPSYHETVIYRFNRAIIFNPKIFHRSNAPNFDISKPEGMRLSMTYSFHCSSEMQRQIRMLDHDNKNSARRKN